jgi:hypothetical protein
MQPRIALKGCLIVIETQAIYSNFALRWKLSDNARRLTVETRGYVSPSRRRPLPHAARRQQLIRARRALYVTGPTRPLCDSRNFSMYSDIMKGSRTAVTNRPSEARIRLACQIDILVSRKPDYGVNREAQSTTLKKICEYAERD